MPVDTNYELKLTGTMQGDVWQNVFHVQCISAAAGGRTADVGRAIDGFITAIVSKYIAVACPDVQFVSIRCTEVGIADPIVQTKAIATPGERSGDPLPPSDAVLITKRCNTGGRRNVGHTYVVGVDDILAQGGIVDVNDPDLTALAVAMRTDYTNAGNTYRFGIWHRGTASMEFITITNIRAQISRQNRRKVPVL